MSILRMFLAWMLLLALPLQGQAAASMLLCGPARTAASAASDHVPGTDADAGAHPHSAYGGPIDAHEHSLHATVPMTAADDGQADDLSALTDEACPSCAACAASCHAMALSGSAPVVQPAFLPEHRASPPRPLAGGPAVPVPDKPPRA